MFAIFKFSSHDIGCSTVVFNLISELFIFHASSDTLIVSVHSSLIVVHEVIVFQLIDSDTMQFLVLLSLRDATNSLHI